MIGGTTSRISGAGTEQTKIGSWSSGADHFMRRQNLKLSQWSKSENDFGQKNVREKTAANSNVGKEAAEGGKSIVRISISRVAGIVVAAAGHGHGRGTATGRRVSDWNVTFVPEVRMLQSL